MLTNDQITRLKSYAQEEGVVVEIYEDYEAGSQVQAEGLRVFLEMWRVDAAGNRHGPERRDYLGFRGEGMVGAHPTHRS